MCVHVYVGICMCVGMHIGMYVRTYVCIFIHVGLHDIFVFIFDR